LVLGVNESFATGIQVEDGIQKLLVWTSELSDVLAEATTHFELKIRNGYIQHIEIYK
jgi:hypothetical protein